MKTPFVLAAVQGGTMILNYLDADPEAKVDGPGANMLTDGFRDPNMTGLVIRMIESRRQTHGDGVVVIDGGAHVGSYTIPWARYLRGFGSVVAFEPQRWIYMALCGNVVLNNCFNVDARRSALGALRGSINIPRLDPAVPVNSGGTQAGTGEDKVPLTAIDDLLLPRCDIIKLDLEGMEPAALVGAAHTIRVHKPIIIAEHFICGHEAILNKLPGGYRHVGMGAELLCVHEDEPNKQLLADVEQMHEKFKSDAAVRCSSDAA